MDGKNALYQLDRRVDEGLIRKQRHATLPLTIYSYTNECQHSGAWDKYTTMARGLILNDDGAPVATPFSKFFNYGEPNCPDLPRDIPYDIFEKMDGSLGINFYYGGKWHVATRGSFDNEYVDYASGFLSYLDSYPTHYTVCTEICMPRQIDGLERPVPHQPGSYLLGAIDLWSGMDMHHTDIFSQWPGDLPRVFSGSVEKLSELAKTETGTEGWVIRWRNGFRIKIKTAWYNRLFRVICRLEETVRDGMIKAIPKRDILRDLPEELKAEAEQVYTQIRKWSLEREHYLLGETLANWDDDKKTFALRIQQHPEKSFLFSLYDDKDIVPALIAAAPVLRIERDESSG